MIAAADVSMPAGVQSTSTVPSAMPESIDAVIGFQSAPPAVARLPFRTAPDPFIVHGPLGPFPSGVCAVSAVAFAPVNVSKIATDAVLTVTSAVDDEPWMGIAVIVALPAPAPVTLAALPVSGATGTAVAFDVVHEKFMSGITLCALSYAVAVKVTDWKSGTVADVGVTVTLAAVGTKFPSTSKFAYVDCQS